MRSISFDVAADDRSFTVDVADDALRVDDEGRAQRHALLLVEDAERARQLALDVRQHREGQVLQVLVVVRHARCTNSLSVDRPSTCASRSSKACSACRTRRSRSGR